MTFTAICYVATWFLNIRIARHRCITETPREEPVGKKPKLSECSPLFMAVRSRRAELSAVCQTSQHPQQRLAHQTIARACSWDWRLWKWVKRPTAYG